MSNDPYPWYRPVDSAVLEQGDLLRAIPILVPVGSVDSRSEIAGEIREYDAILMTQSCDIENDKVKSLLLCPAYGLWEFVEASKVQGENWGKDIREKLRQGNLPGYHLLNEADVDGLQLPLTVVDFHEVFTAPKNQLLEIARTCGPRLRLCPPYKEHLAQAFARFFMRVGLPVAISRDRLAKQP